MEQRKGYFVEEEAMIDLMSFFDTIPFGQVKKFKSFQKLIDAPGLTVDFKKDDDNKPNGDSKQGATPPITKNKKKGK